MKYDPTKIMHREILSAEERAWLLAISKNYPLDDFLKDNRNFEEAAVDFVYTSAKIEGNTYDRIDTDGLVRMGVTAGGKKHTDALMIVNLKSAFDDVMQADENTVIDKDYICNLHKVLMENLLPKKEQGMVRMSAVSIGATEYQPLESFTKLTEEMKTMVQVANQYSNDFERAIYLHCNLAYLQYFKDGNKRTARLTQTSVLVQSGILPLFFSAKLIEKYKRAVISYYETGEYRAYVDFFKENYFIAMERLIGKEPKIVLEAKEPSILKIKM